VIMYMLDTNIIIKAIRQKEHPIRQILLQHLHGELCISSITYVELLYGVFRSENPEKNLQALQGMLAWIDIKPFDSNAACFAGKTMAYLAAKGQMIGDRDVLIASHALSLGMTIVTHNTKEFERVPGLKLEDWLSDSPVLHEE